MQSIWVSPAGAQNRPGKGRKWLWSEGKWRLISIDRGRPLCGVCVCEVME